MGLELLLRRRHRVDRPVALVERWRLHVLWQDYVAIEPRQHRAPLRPRADEPVGDHHEHGVFEVRGVAGVAHASEERLEIEAPEVGVAGGDRPVSGRFVDRRLVDRQPRLLGVGPQRGDDAIELAGVPQLCHLAEAKERVVGHLPVDAGGLDQRQVLVGLIAPFADRRLDEHHKQDNTPVIPTEGLCRPYIWRTVGAGESQKSWSRA